MIASDVVLSKDKAYISTAMGHGGTSFKQHDFQGKDVAMSGMWHVSVRS